MSDLEPDDVELRRAARERALELLYEAELKGLAVEELLAGLPLAPDDLTVELVRGTDAHRADVDGLLQRLVAPRWSLHRLAAVDRAVLRLGAYELLVARHRSEAIVINEAVVLARRFGTDDSPRFVNGVLSALAAEVRGGAPDQDPAVADVGARPAGTDPGRPARPVRPVVDALVMDLDGVIRHWDEPAVAAGDEALGLPPGTLAGAAFEPDRLDRCMRGLITADEWFLETGEVIARRHPVVAEAVAEIMAGIGWRIDESVMDLVDRARRTFPVALLSNASSRLLDDLRVSGIDDRFDAVVGSAALGVVKPERAAYLAAAEALGVQPARCLMVDDRAENVEGASSAGMRAVLFTEVAALERELASAGVIDAVEATADVRDTSP